MMPTYHTGDGTYIINDWNDLYSFAGVVVKRSNVDYKREAFDLVMFHQGIAQRQNKLEGMMWICDDEWEDPTYFRIVRHYARSEKVIFIPRNLDES